MYASLARMSWVQIKIGCTWSHWADVSSHNNIKSEAIAWPICPYKVFARYGFDLRSFADRRRPWPGSLVSAHITYYALLLLLLRSVTIYERRILISPKFAQQRNNTFSLQNPLENGWNAILLHNLRLALRLFLWFYAYSIQGDLHRQCTEMYFWKCVQWVVLCAI